VTALTARLRAIPSWQVTLGLALLGLGFLIAAQLASEGPRIRYTTQERTPLVETALDLQAQQESLKDQILSLRAALGELEAAGGGGAAVTRDLNQQLEQARIAAGLVALQGPGLVIQLKDSGVPVPADGSERDYLVSGQDVLTVVEELWLAGPRASPSTASGSRPPRRSWTSAGRSWSTRPTSSRPTRWPRSAPTTCSTS
jgi:uncharacterized protein YlxW (UPF0749 family)